MACTYGHMSGEMTLMKVYENTVQMLFDRGYASVSQRCNYVSDLLECISKDLPVAIATNCADKEDICIFYHIENKIGIKNLRTLLDSEKLKDKIVCVVSIDGPTTFTKKDVMQIDQEVQFLTFKNMFVNISKHSMVPQHRKLSKEEAAQVKTKFNIQSADQWPRILMKDPIRVYYDFRKGDIIECQRRGMGTQEVSMFYRMVH